MTGNCLHAMRGHKIFCKTADQSLHRLTKEVTRFRKEIALMQIGFKVGQMRRLPKLQGRYYSKADHGLY